jgi:phosphate transport system permease protein
VSRSIKKSKKNKLEKSALAQLIGFFFLRLATYAVLFILIYFLYDIGSKGYKSISWEFLTEAPRKGMTQGGILPAIVGTFLVTMITAIVAVPLGMAAAVYLNEYARAGRLTRLIRLSIRNLAGVPSIVYGLFGVILFVNILKFGTSVLSAGLTLGLLTLPWTITASEEALKSVPDAYREGALALGATKWQMIKTNVLPYSIPGMLTGAVLGLARAAGETAPIMFTGAAFYLPYLPRSLKDQFMALPYHLYIMATQHHAIDKARGIAYGTALVLIVFIVLFNLGAIIIRARLRNKWRN